MSWLQDEVAKMSYKPGWTLEVVEPLSYLDALERYARGGFLGSFGSVLVVRFEARDSVHPERTTPIAIGAQDVIPAYFAEMRDAEAFRDWVHSILHDKIERHETDEWFRYNGELVNDPHAKDKVSR